MIAASRPVNKNVNTGAVIRAKPGTDRAGRSWTSGELYIKPVVTSSGHERLERKNRSSLFRFWTHSDA